MPVSTVQAPRLSGRVPLLGHLPMMRRDPLAMLLRAAELGGVTRLDLGPRGPCYLVTDPDGVKRIFLDNYANYTKQTRGFDTLRVFLGQGLLTSEGSFWRKQRRIAQPAFHHGKIQRFAEVMSGAAEELTRRWNEPAREGRTFDVSDEMMQVTLRIVGECLFSTDPSHESSAIGPPVELLLKKFITRISSPLVLPLSWPVGSNREVRRSIRTMHEIVDEIIEQRRESSKETMDLLGMLMSARDEETGEGMSPAQLRDEVLTLLVAGHETTAAALSWTWVLLSQHPEIDERLEQELSKLDDGPVTLEGLQQIPFVSHVIQESMRLYPPAYMVARKVEKDDEICGVKVLGGNLVLTSPYASHRRAATFKDPHRFDPDRFGAGAPEGGYSRYEYLPFGAGPRICIGNGFAMMEAQIVLATLRRRFRLRLTSPTVEPEPLLTLRCKNGAPVRADPVAGVESA